jgi:hypothetical protein
MAKQTIEIDRAALIEALRGLEAIVVSLDRIGSASANLSKAEYDRLSSEFLDDWDVSRKLARLRTVLSQSFSEELGADEMDELEREMQGLKYWSLADPKP